MSDFVPEPDYPGILDDQPDMFDAIVLPEPPHDQLEPAVDAGSGSRIAGAEPVGRLAPPHLRPTRRGHPTLLAPPPRNGLGAVRAAPALTVRTTPNRTAPHPWAGTATSPTPASVDDRIDPATDEVRDDVPYPEGG